MAFERNDLVKAIDARTGLEIDCIIGSRGKFYYDRNCWLYGCTMLPSDGFSHPVFADQIIRHLTQEEQNEHFQKGHL
jgi:hypothetical protein